MSVPTADPTTISEPPRLSTTSTARRGSARWQTGPRLRANPVLRRELRVRMRGRRAFVILGAFLLLIGGIVLAIHRLLVGDESGGTLQSFQVGQFLFVGFTMVEMSLIALIAPALTATAIAGEREGGTFDLLRSTPVRAHTIVWGKLAAALSYAGLLIVASIPIASAVFLFGGVAPADVWNAFLLLGITTVTFGLVGLCCSALVRRVGLASVLAYVVTVVIIVGSIGAYVFLDALDGGMIDNQQFDQSAIPAGGNVVVSSEAAADDGGLGPLSDDQLRLLLSINPMMAMASLLADSIDQAQADPWSGRPVSVEIMDAWLEFVRVGDAAFTNAFDAQGRPIQAQPVDETPLWHRTVWIYAITSVVLFWVTTALVARHASRRRRWMAKDRGTPS